MNTRNSTVYSRIHDTENQIFILSSDDSELEDFEAKFTPKFIQEASESLEDARVARNNSKVVGRSSRGRLENILKIPLDVMLEIYGYLEPLDILRLSRTSKDLRAFLMIRSNAIVWRTARSNVPDLPPLPFDLSEPQYANLAFDSYCHICMRKPCEAIIWQCRVRCCNKCFSSTLYSRSNLHSVWKRSYASTFIVFKEIAQYIPYVNVVPWKGPWDGEDKVYFPPNVRSLRHEYRRVRKGEMELEDWVMQKKKAYEEIMKHTAACSDWQISSKNKRSEELKHARSRRKIAIYDKLRALGWGNEVDKLEAEGSSLLSAHRAVRQTKDLTDKAWNNMRPQLIKLLEDQRL
ncbi:hypothetical protein GGU10DRAFT_30471 [Lentinula aff. detonsa]|uniref:F-box domain-containing protein n=1 Tax=Lentinula aff. detonsa TaxID=2804958 RepID=A0AA38NL95_9AGAR|nr:hypothetical protein GGU10DRAFT_30471 [Lentinula aff. detonsa]